ncbi:MAG TPA: FHA domain-containing protein [Kofleriaceae bacterium]
MSSTGYARVAAPPVPARLVGVAGPVAGQTFALKAETRIGRSIANDVVIPSALLSRGHARIIYAVDCWMLQDLGSTSGSCVNGKQARSVELAEGNIVRLGDAELRFERVPPGHN